MDTLVTYTSDSCSALDAALARLDPAGVMVIADSNTAVCAAEPLMRGCAALRTARMAVVPAGEEYKTIETACDLWRQMTGSGVTRRWTVVNVGGGVVTDLGGFAAATFKRGVSFVNVPTTVLAAVDAAVGGKTGIDFMGLKNEIGVFAPAREVIVSAEWFATLPRPELLSGYGEMLKHALLAGGDMPRRVLGMDLEAPANMAPLLRESVEFKRRVTESDPTERGPRKQLNLGHTAGHAFEMLAMEHGKKVPHGHAVAQGLVTALVLSRMLCGAGEEDMLYAVASRVKELYGPTVYKCGDYSRLTELMGHDKKNISSDRISFTLLPEAGHPVWDNIVAPRDIHTALDITADLLN